MWRTISFPKISLSLVNFTTREEIFVQTAILSFYRALEKSVLSTILPNFEAIASKMTPLEGVKFFHKTGNRKISAQPIGPKIGGNSPGPYCNIPAKLGKIELVKKFGLVKKFDAS